MRIFIIISVFLLFTAIVQAQDGEQYELAKIEFEGNNGLSSSTLKDIIYSEETPWWFYKWLNSFTPLGAGPVYFDSSYIKIDIESLKEFYNANGFFEAQISSRYDVDTTEKEVTLIYTIKEGEVSNYGLVNIIGLDSIKPEYFNELKNEFKADSNKRYSQITIQENATSVVSSLMNNGYMLGRFDSTVIFRDTAFNRANLNIFFTTGNQYRVDSVFAERKGEGADLVASDLIVDVSGIETGELYDYEKFSRKQNTLFRTGLFSSVAINPVVKDTSGDKVPLNIESFIGPLNELSPEFIVNNQQSAFNVGLGASYTKRNFLGAARKLTAQFSFGLQDIFKINYSQLVRNFSFRDTTFLGYAEGRVTIGQPDIFEEDIYGTLDNYFRIQKLRTINTTTYGSKITFEFELPSYTWVNMLSVFYNVEQVNEVYKRNDSLNRQLLSVVGADIGKTTTDNLLFPTRGYNITFQIEEANSLPYLITKLLDQGFNGSLFYKLVLTNAVYSALDSKKFTVAAAKLKLGHLSSYIGSFDKIPNTRTFYTGGSNSIRGWRPNQLPGIENKGGGFLMEGTFELRYKFVPTFGAAVFFDYGNTWRKYTQFRYDEVALSPGLGFRYYSSVAPFRIDFGFKLYDPADKKYIFKKPFFPNIEFHFGIGEAF